MAFVFMPVSSGWCTQVDAYLSHRESPFFLDAPVLLWVLLAPEGHRSPAPHEVTSGSALQLLLLLRSTK